MNTIRFLKSNVVTDYISEKGILGEEFSADNLLKGIDSQVGGIIYIDNDYMNSETENILTLSESVQFILITNSKYEISLSGPSKKDVDNVYMRATFAEMAGVTYVHELNNHLAIICGRLYELDKLAKNMGGEEGEKLLGKSTSISEKVDRVTDISRLFTRKSIKAICPRSEEPYPMKEVIENVKRDYRKIFEKNSNAVDNVIGDEFTFPESQVIDMENTFLTILLKLSSCTKKDGEGSETSISAIRQGEKTKIFFSCYGELQDEIREQVFHQNWTEFVKHAQENGFEVDYLTGDNKIDISLTF